MANLKKIMKRSLIFSVFLLGFLLFGFAQEHQYVKDGYGNMIGDTLTRKDTVLEKTRYSIKNRLNIRISLSFNQTNDFFYHYHWLEPIRTTFQARANLRADCNYGVLNWLEVGGYIGYIRYENMTKEIDFYLNKPENWKTKLPLDLAPTFGINANVHPLSFLKVKKDCRWQWYVTAKYGGTYLIGHLPYYVSAILIDSKTMKRKEIEFNEKRYRHEFGIGMGGGFYFWKGLGVYVEVLGGQYSYFPEVFNRYYNARVGFEYKFMPKSKNNKTETK